VSRGKSLGNMGSAEVSLRQQTIMDGAEQAQICRYRGSATRPWLLVVNLQKRARRTATTTVAHVGAAQAIALYDLALDGVRDVLAVCPLAPQLDPERFSRFQKVERLVGLGEALPLHLFQGKVERPLEHRRDVTVWNGVTDQGLEKLELFFQG
jgi:hypothetical protein